MPPDSHMFVNFTNFLLLLVSDFTLLWLKKHTYNYGILKLTEVSVMTLHLVYLGECFLYTQHVYSVFLGCSLLSLF